MNKVIALLLLCIPYFARGMQGLETATGHINKTLSDDKHNRKSMGSYENFLRVAKKSTTLPTPTISPNYISIPPSDTLPGNPMKFPPETICDSGNDEVFLYEYDEDQAGYSTSSKEKHKKCYLLLSRGLSPIDPQEEDI